MSGLLWKDLLMQKRLLGKSLLPIVVVGISLSFLSERMAFAFVMLGGMLSMSMIMQSFASDYHSKWILTVITLPINRRIIVLEHFAFGGILVLISSVLFLLPTMLYFKVAMSMMLYVTIFYIGVLSILLSVVITLKIIFGEEKSRFIIPVSLIVFPALLGTILKNEAFYPNVIQSVSSLTVNQWTLIGVTIVLILVSLCIGLSIMFFQKAEL